MVTVSISPPMDMLPSDTSVFPSWDFNVVSGSQPPRTEIDPGIDPKGSLMQRGVHHFIPFFKVANVNAVEQAVIAHQLMDNDVEVKEKGTSHPVSGTPYIVFTDPDGCWIGAYQ